MNRLTDWLNRLTHPRTREDYDFVSWAEQVSDHNEVCQCQYKGRLTGDLIARCEPHTGAGLRDCRWHAHMYNRPDPNAYETGPG
jgi:hypothetical protein